MKREKEYKGIWINSNMKSHESFKDSKCQVDRAVVEVTSPDGSNKRKVGMLGVLSDVEGLYKPNAFGGKFFPLSSKDCVPKFATGRGEVILEIEGESQNLRLCYTASHCAFSSNLDKNWAYLMHWKN